MLLDLTTTALRWNRRRHSWRPLAEPFDPAQFSVEPIGARTARDFVAAHHYSGSFPVAVASFGLFERVGMHRTQLAGAAVFSVPIQAKAAASYGAGDAVSCDLGRFLLLDHVGGNAETWFLARALRLLRQGHSEAAQLVIAYSDPMPRTDADGRIRFAGHFGGIYRDSSATYLGRTRPRSVWLTPAGTVLSDRALSKLRTDDRGAAYAYAVLRQHGAPPRCLGETGPAYVGRALSEGPFRRMHHRGNHIYAFPIGTGQTRRKMRGKLEKNLPFPTVTDTFSGTNK